MKFYFGWFSSYLPSSSIGSLEISDLALMLMMSYLNLVQMRIENFYVNIRIPRFEL